MADIDRIDEENAEMNKRQCHLRVKRFAPGRPAIVIATVNTWHTAVEVVEGDAKFLWCGEVKAASSENWRSPSHWATVTYDDGTRYEIMPEKEGAR